ncbi:MAG: hypothetical protein K9I31_03805 [Chitinophagaceae bacterium]|jgi:hypothetical protein|nr:hypothetical protein [Chitinophagaceae bacterium]
MNLRIVLYGILLLTVLNGCSKSGDSPTPAPPTPVAPIPTESSIAFTVDIDPGSTNVFAALSSSQTIIVNISSTLPKDGATIDLNVKRERDNVTIWNTSISTLSAANTMKIDSLKPGELCVATIVTTSKNTSSNNATKSFKIARK